MGDLAGEFLVDLLGVVCGGDSPGFSNSRTEACDAKLTLLLNDFLRFSALSVLFEGE